MKRINIFYVGVAVIVTIMSIYGVMSLEKGGTLYKHPMAPRFHLRTDFPTFEREIWGIYRIVPVEFNRSRFEYIGAKFGLTGEPKFIDENYSPATYLLTGKEGETLEYHTPTGVWIYIDPNKAYHASSDQPDVPSDLEARQIAESFLRENGFWSENMTFSHIGYNVQGIGEKNTGKIISEYVFAKKIYFDQQLDGLKLRGVGAKAIVTIGEGGKVVSFILPTRIFQIVGNASLISPEKAYENLQEGIGIRYKDKTIYEGRDIDIENISLCYYIDSLVENTGSIIPCYVFEGKFRDTGEEFITFVNAVEI